MSVVKSFDPRLAFVTKDNKRSDTTAKEDIPNDLHMSCLLAYMYLATKYLKGKAKVIIKEPYHSVVRELFANSENILKEYPDDTSDNKVMTLSAVVPSSKFKDGEVMMPLYLSLTNTKLYNIHDINAEVINTNEDHVKGCINFFNCFVRSGRGGITRVVWSDSISLDTKLQDFTYDQMFGLYVCDKYLTRIDPLYREADGSDRLPIALACLDLLKEKAEQLSSIGKVVIRDITSYIKAVIKSLPLAPITIQGGEVKNKLDVNLPMSYKAAVISFLKRLGVSKKDSFTLIVYGPFTNYSFITDLFVYMGAKFHVWCEEGSVLPKSPKVKKLTGRFDATSCVNCYLYSTAKANDVTLEKFASAGGASALVHVGSTNYSVSDVLMPVYADVGSLPYCIVNTSNLVKTSISDKKELVLLATDYYKSFNSSYRNMNKWEYTVPIPGKKALLTPKPVSYDAAYLLAVSTGN